MSSHHTAFTGLGRTSPSNTWFTTEPDPGNFHNAVGMCSPFVSGGNELLGVLAGPFPAKVKMVELYAMP